MDWRLTGSSGGHTIGEYEKEHGPLNPKDAIPDPNEEQDDSDDTPTGLGDKRNDELVDNTAIGDQEQDNSEKTDNSKSSSSSGGYTRSSATRDKSKVKHGTNRRYTRRVSRSSKNSK